MIFTALRVVHKNQQIFFVINNLNFSRESNLKIEKYLTFNIIILTFQKTINDKLINYN